MGNEIKTPIQLALKGVWTDPYGGCPHSWEGICTQKWEMCSYREITITGCPIFEKICHERAVSMGIIIEQEDKTWILNPIYAEATVQKTREPEITLPEIPSIAD